MNENEFEVDGVKYNASPIYGQISCNGCAAIEIGSELCVRFPACFKGSRVDRTNVIFVEVQDERAQR